MGLLIPISTPVGVETSAVDITEITALRSNAGTTDIILKSGQIVVATGTVNEVIGDLNTGLNNFLNDYTPAVYDGTNSIVPVVLEDDLAYKQARASLDALSAAYPPLI